MGKAVLCEESLATFLEGITVKNGFIPGLIVGQFSECAQSYYVIHLPLIPLACSDEDTECDGEPGIKGELYKNIIDINESLISDHARTVTRMLPGGMWILGFYIVGSGDIFDDKSALIKVRSLANAVHNCTKGNEFMCGKDPSRQKLIFHFCPVSKKYMCKSLDMSSLTSCFRPEDWKFKSPVTNWLQINSNLDLNNLPMILLSEETDKTKERLQEVLMKFKKHFDSLVCCINHQFCPAETKVLQVQQPKENTEETDGDIYNLVYYESPNKMSEQSEAQHEGVPIELLGGISSIVFVNAKATVEEVDKAVREDMLRSFASRLEMHWQTFEPDEDSNCPYTIRRPPRRVLFTPKNGTVSFSEYLFEGETLQDALASIKENLGLTEGSIKPLEDEWENTEKTTTCTSRNATAEGSTMDKPNKKSKAIKPESNRVLLLAIIVAGISLIISLVFHFKSS